MRSAWSRTNSTGSTPPISRWPVSKHQGTSVWASAALDLGGGLDERPDVRVQDELEPVAGGEVGELAQVRAGALPAVVVERRRAPTSRGPDAARRRRRSAPPAASWVATRAACSRVRAVGLVHDERDEPADQAQPVAVEHGAHLRRRRAAASPWAPSSVAFRPSAAISASTRSGGSCRPQPGTSHTPHEMGAARRIQRPSACRPAAHASPSPPSSAPRLERSNSRRP